MSIVHNDVLAVLAAGETGVVDGQAVYLNAAGEAVTCEENDYYRCAGFTQIITDGEAASIIRIIRDRPVVALNDGASVYLAGDRVTCGAGGIVVAERGAGLWVVDGAAVAGYAASAGDEAADTIPIPESAESVLQIRNDTQTIDFAIVNPDVAQAAGQLSVDYATDLMSGNVIANEIVQNDLFEIHINRKREIVGVVMARAEIAAPLTIMPMILGGV